MKVGGRKAYRPNLPLGKRSRDRRDKPQAGYRLMEGKMVAGLPKRTIRENHPLSALFYQ